MIDCGNMISAKDYIFRKEHPVSIESNETVAYFGEWVVLRVHNWDNEEVEMEVRMPMEYALEHDLIKTEDS